MLVVGLHLLADGGLVTIFPGVGVVLLGIFACARVGAGAGAREGAIVVSEILPRFAIVALAHRGLGLRRTILLRGAARPLLSPTLTLRPTTPRWLRGTSRSVAPLTRSTVAAEAGGAALTSTAATVILAVVLLVVSRVVLPGIPVVCLSEGWGRGLALDQGGAAQEGAEDHWFDFHCFYFQCKYLL